MRFILSRGKIKYRKHMAVPTFPASLYSYVTFLLAYFLLGLWAHVSRWKWNIHTTSDGINAFESDIR